MGKQPKLIGYVNTAVGLTPAGDQEQQLRSFNCWNVYIEKSSREHRELDLALTDCRRGDILVVTPHGYLATLHKYRRAMLRSLLKTGARFHIAGMPLDVRDPACRVVARFLLSSLELQSRAHSEKVKSGLKRGLPGGRPRSLSPLSRDLVRLLLEQGASMQEAAEAAGVSRTTLYEAGLRSKRKGRPRKDRPKAVLP